MKFFKNKETYISANVKFVGNMDADANITIDGDVFGNIKSKKHVMLGAGSHYEGTIECNSALLCGNLVGRVVAEETLEAKTPATIVGDLIATSVRVDSGVTIRGGVMSNPSEQRILATKTDGDPKRAEERGSR